jgi:phage head maturation protease
LDTVAGTQAYARVKAGILKALSVGFRLPSEQPQQKR